MTLTNINTMKKDRGFTLVELMIVIVVIAILAAISIVAFAGIQQRSRDASRLSDVEGIQKSLTTYVGDDDTTSGGGNGTWPAATDVAAKLKAYKVASIGDTISSRIQAADPTDSTKDKYGYSLCGSPATGAKITWWKESAGAVQTVKVGTGC